MRRCGAKQTLVGVCAMGCMAALPAQVPLGASGPNALLSPRSWRSPVWQSPSFLAPSQAAGLQHRDRCDAIRVELSLHNCEIRFNLGNVFAPDAQQTGSITGTLSVSAPVAMRLLLPAGVAPDQSWRTTGQLVGALGSESAAATPIDLSVLLRRDGGPARPPDELDCTDPAFVYWFDAGTHAIEYQITILPSRLQAPGAYTFGTRFGFAALPAEAVTGRLAGSRRQATLLQGGIAPGSR